MFIARRNTRQAQNQNSSRISGNLRRRTLWPQRTRHRNHTLDHSTITRRNLIRPGPRDRQHQHRRRHTLTTPTRTTIARPRTSILRTSLIRLPPLIRSIRLSRRAAAPRDLRHILHAHVARHALAAAHLHDLHRRHRQPLPKKQRPDQQQCHRTARHTHSSIQPIDDFASQIFATTRTSPHHPATIVARLGQTSANRHSLAT